MKVIQTTCSALLLSFAIFPRVAHAQEWTRQSFLLPKGGFEITGQPARPELMNINMGRNNAFKPINFPVDFFWGVTDDVMIGITHDTGPRFNTGATDSKFRNTYNDVGFGALIYLAGGRNYEVDLDTGVPFHSLSPLWIGARVGILGRANLTNTVELVYDPGIYLGLNHRYPDGNWDGLFIPIWFYFQATDTIAPFVGTGVNGSIRRFGDDFEIPLEGGVLFNVGRGINIGGMLRFPNAAGQNNTLDNREIGFLGQFRF